jgi:nitrile hydratase accessory protein
MSEPTPPPLPGQTAGETGPVFREPWEAQAFALAVELSQAGHFTWNEWASALGKEIETAQAGGDPDLGDTYYHHWLTALERLVTDKGLVFPGDMRDRRDAWEQAYLDTPHGLPVKLKESS